MPVGAIPTLYLKLDEASGATRLDATGGGRSFTQAGTGNVGSVAGKLNNAADFTGANRLIRASDSTLQTGTASWSMSIWYKADSLSGNRAIVAKHDGGSAAGSEHLLLGGTTLRFTRYNGGAADNRDWTASLTTGVWYHIVWGYDATNTRMFLRVNNGTAVYTTQTGGNATSANLQLGAATGTFHLDGQLDEFGYWKDYVLTDADVTLLYGGGTPPNYETVSGIAAALDAGLASCTAFSFTTASLSVTASSGGTSPYTSQWYLSTTAGFTPGIGNLVSGATGDTVDLTGLTPGTTYYAKRIVTDSQPVSATSSEASFTTSYYHLHIVGNSQSDGGATPWSATNLQAMLGTGWVVTVEAVSGQTTETMVNNFASQVTAFYEADAAVRMLAIQEVINDIYFGATAQEAYDNQEALAALAKVGGWTHVVSVLPQDDRNDFPGSSTLPGADGAAKRAEFIARVAAMKAMVYADRGSLDGYFDPTLDVRVAVGSAYINGDGVHWEALMDTLVATQFIGMIPMVLNFQATGGGVSRGRLVNAGGI